MAFNVDNAVKYGNIESVDTSFSAIAVELNYTDDVMVPGETYNDEIERDAAQLMVRKLGKGNVQGGDVTKANGLKFNTDETADELMTLLSIFPLSKSELCQGKLDLVRASGKLAQKKAVVLRAHQEAWQAQAIALMLGGKNGGLNATNHTLSANTDKPVNDGGSQDITNLILAAQTQILEGDASSNVCIVSPEMRALLLSQRARAIGFIPEVNQQALRRGIIGDLFGLKVKVSNHIGRGSNIAGKIKAGVNGVHADIVEGAQKALITDFMVYDWRTWYINTTFTGTRENTMIGGYFGLSVDVQTISGALNTNPERCIVHQTIASGGAKAA